MNFGKSPLVVALYLLQFYETGYNNKRWEQGIPSGLRVKEPNPSMNGVTSHTCLSTTTITTCRRMM